MLPREMERRNRNGVARALRNNRNAMTYGAMGPDPFFFNLNDLTTDGIASKLVELWDFVGHISYKLDQVFQPVQDVMVDVKGEMNKGVDTLTANSPLARRAKNLLNRLSEIGRLFSNVMRGFVKKTVLDTTDPFGFYVSPYQTCVDDHEEWWWFDTLHSRQTGEFATQLLDIARGNTAGMDGGRRTRDQLLSYAVGYLSHFAADVVGHAYVNTMVGGPYRLNQAQRHTTQEKIMDVYAYDHYYNDDGLLKRLDAQRGDRFYQNPNLLNSGLHKNQQFTDGKYDPKDYQIDHDKLFNRPKNMHPIASGLELPDEISRNFAQAANAVYDTSEYGRLTPDEVDQSYRLWYLVLRNSTSTTNVVHPSDLPDIDPISEETRNAWEDFKNWFRNTFNSSPGGGGGGGQCGAGQTFLQQAWDCLKSAAESIWNFVSNVAKAIAEFVKTFVALVRYAIEDLLSMPLVALNFMLQKLYEQVYTSYRTLLLLVTSLGFGYCYNDQIHHGAIKHLWDPEAEDHFGATAKDGIIMYDTPGASGYPREGIQMARNMEAEYTGWMDGLSQEGHLVVPTETPIERPETIPGPDVYGVNTPEVFISDPDDDLTLDPAFIAYPPGYESDTRTASATGIPTRGDYHPTTGSNSGRFADPVLGDAVSLTGELFERYLVGDFKRVPNLNMSGDRGIGFPTWVNDRDPRCTSITRKRWAIKHGSNIDWLNTPIDAVFQPDTDSHY